VGSDYTDDGRIRVVGRVIMKRPTECRQSKCLAYVAEQFRRNGSMSNPHP